MNHVLCADCWGLLNPGRQPVLVKGSVPEPCCRCEKPADPPTYVRAAWEDFHPSGETNDATHPRRRP